jgi:hypothetical protein
MVDFYKQLMGKYYRDNASLHNNYKHLDKIIYHISKFIASEKKKEYEYYFNNFKKLTEDMWKNKNWKKYNFTEDEIKCIIRTKYPYGVDFVKHNYCLDELWNGDTMINERIMLIIENSVLLTEHYGTYNFPGGRVPYDYLGENIGATSLKELKEELGITFKDDINVDLKLVSHYFDKDKCLRLLVIAKVNRDDILFGNATHVWESKNFTLLPLDKDFMKTYEIGTMVEESILKANSKCATHLKYNDGLGKVYDKKMKEHVSKKNSKFYIQLTESPKLTDKELDLLREINKKINGYDDTKYVYRDDYICKYEYVPFGKTMKLSISNNFKNGYTHNVKVVYDKLIHHLYKKDTVDKSIMAPYKSEYDRLIKEFFTIISEIKN